MENPHTCVFCPVRWVFAIIPFVGFLLALAWPKQVWAQGIDFDVATENDSGSAAVSSLTWSHTVTSAESNRILMVDVAVRNATARTVSGITYAGTNLSRVGTAGTTSKVEMWMLVNPATGAHNVVVTLSGTARTVAGAASFTGVNQTTPLGSFVSATGTSTAPSVNVPSVNEGEVVIDSLIANVPLSSTLTATVNASQTQLWNAVTTSTAAANARGAASIEPSPAGGGTVTMSWGLSTSRVWSIGAVAIKPANATAVKLSSFAATRYLFQPNMTVGEAILRAKFMTGNADVRRTWEYFGDPTLRMARVR